MVTHIVIVERPDRDNNPDVHTLIDKTDEEARDFGAEEKAWLTPYIPPVVVRIFRVREEV